MDPDPFFVALCRGYAQSVETACTNSQNNKFVNLSKSKYELENKFKIKIDYLEFRDEKKMKLDNFKSKYRLFIAYHINGVRLIDNF